MTLPTPFSYTHSMAMARDQFQFYVDYISKEDKGLPGHDAC